MDGVTSTGVSGDKITLRLPPDPGFRRVAVLVLGGLAVRLNLTLEHLADLEIAVESLLERSARDGIVTLELRIGDGSISAAVGPVDGRALRLELDAGDGDGGVSLRRVLEVVADRFELGERDGVEWLSIEKHVQAEGQRAE